VKPVNILTPAVPTACRVLCEPRKTPDELLFQTSSKITCLK
jgi:hypothetical protein